MRFSVMHMGWFYARKYGQNEILLLQRLPFIGSTLSCVTSFRKFHSVEKAHTKTQGTLLLKLCR